MSIEFCAHCAEPEPSHENGQCPVVVKKTVPYKNASNMPIPGPGRRGRPPGKGIEAAQIRLAAKIAHSNAKLLGDRALAVGLDAVASEFKGTPEVYRSPNRKGAPDRSVSEMKDDAVRLLNQQLWNLEGKANEGELTENEEARLLKLLGGFNAALPKQTEKKPLSEMTEEELDALEK